MTLDYEFELDIPDDSIPTRVMPPEKKAQQPKSKSAMELKLAEIKGDIEDILNDSALGVAEFGFVTTGYVMADGSQDFADSLVEMARNRPRLLKALEKYSKASKGINLGKYFAAILMAVMVDMGTRSPDGMVKERLGITEAFKKTHSIDEQSTQTGQPWNSPFSPPPRL